MFFWQVADSKTKIFRNFDDTSDPSVPHYEINWYLPDLQPEDKYHITDGFNQHTLYIKVLFLFSSCQIVQSGFWFEVSVPSSSQEATSKTNHII